LNRKFVVLLLGAVLMLQTLGPTAAASSPKNISGVAGYQVAGPPGSITRIKGSWVVPTISCDSTSNTNMTISVMLDGLNLSDRMQIGTVAACVSGVPTYGAFVVMLPSKGKVHVPTLTIHAGDVVEAQGKWSTQTKGWHAQIIDETTGTTNTAYVKATSGFTPPLSSGSFLVARVGTSLLSDFGTVGFGRSNTGVGESCIVTATLANGTTFHVITLGTLGGISGFTLTSFNMIDSGKSVMATTGGLGIDGESFTVTWDSSS
jgi:hypothetical protein